MDSQYGDLQRLVAENARVNKRLAFWVKGLALLWALTMTGVFWSTHSKDNVLTARGLVVVDEHGKTRVRIGAPLPEPIMMGGQGKRDDSVSGILIYDALGNERGGYVTDNSVGNALLSLDSNTGQEVTLIAYPNGGAEFAINDDKGNQVALSAVANPPTIRLFHAGTKIFQEPQADAAK